LETIAHARRDQEACYSTPIPKIYDCSAPQQQTLGWSDGNPESGRSFIALVVHPATTALGTFRPFLRDISNGSSCHKPSFSASKPASRDSRKGAVSGLSVSAARPATADIASSAWFVQDAPIHDIMMSILIIVASLRVLVVSHSVV